MMLVGHTYEFTSGTKILCLTYLAYAQMDVPLIATLATQCSLVELWYTT